MLIIDDSMRRTGCGLLDRTSAERFLTEKPGTVELVLTGRGPAEIFLDAADYVSEINCVKHPYTHGIAARRGIEF